MTRNRSKKALYEVMSKARVKPDDGKIVEHLRPKKPDEEALAARRKESAGVPKSAAKWWRKPRIVQLNAGRIEFSMPYQIAVVLLLVFIFVILAAYRLGQSSYPAERQGTDQPVPAVREMDSERPVEQAMSNITQPSSPPENTTAKTEVVEPVKPTGSNVIVLVEYDSLPDLAPVQAHFSEHGIETEIVTERGRYFLQTKQRYDNPAKPGTDGYKAIQKIAEVGKEYKAPSGYDPFSRHYFSDAYGKKVN
ncbi:MAG TPA: hypothetical protein VMX36_04875 [Sedimentisphaerales bacterium]|nr:hypothetical protein [Sedimentisphaerales bacterium]